MRDPMTLAVILAGLYAAIGLVTAVTIARLLISDGVGKAASNRWQSVALILALILLGVVVFALWPLTHVWLMIQMWRDSDLSALLTPRPKQVSMTTLVTETEMRVALMATVGRDVVAETVDHETVTGRVAAVKLTLPRADAPRTALITFAGDEKTEHEVTRVRNGHELILVGLS